MKNRRILALDVATVLGWACRTDDEAVMYGTHDFKGKSLEGGGMRFLRFRNWLSEMRTEINPTQVFFEEVRGFPRQNRGRDSHVYHGFESHLTAFCEEHRIPYQGVGVGKIKKFATGNGAAKKTEVIKAIKALGYEPEDDNQADAIALLLYAEQVALL